MRQKLSKWYAVPPYANEGWKIFNIKGELVATFEIQEDCEKAVWVYNEYVDYENKKNSSNG